jgi:HlyD family secretion protein
MNPLNLIKQRWGTLLLLAAGAALVAHEWKNAKSLAETPTAHAAMRAEPRAILADGRLVAYPGSEVTLSSEIAGRIRALAVEERKLVKKGDLLAELDVSEQQAALSEARAGVRESETQVSYFENELMRNEQLLAQSVISASARDKAGFDRDAARARRVSLLAGVSRLSAVIAKSKIVSPIDGVVTERNVDGGEFVGPGTPLFTVADLSKLRLEVEVGEFDATRVRLGAKVRISVEGNDKSFHGVVEEIPDVVVSRRLKPVDPGRPTDTRVLLVKVRFSEPTPLKLGQRVEAEISL